MGLLSWRELRRRRRGWGEGGEGQEFLFVGYYNAYGGRKHERQKQIFMIPEFERELGS